MYFLKIYYFIIYLKHNKINILIIFLLLKMNNNNLKIIIVNSTLFKMNNEYILTFITYKWIKVFITCTHFYYMHTFSTQLQTWYFTIFWSNKQSIFYSKLFLKIKRFIKKM